MSLGRNEPCHCGSGKKYKKCCLSKDEESRQEKKGEEFSSDTSRRAALDDKIPKQKLDPRVEAGEALWPEFSVADYQAKSALFMRTLDDPELVDAELAFERLNEIFRHTAERGERDRFDALVEELRNRRPEIYDENKAYLLKWRITNALAAGRPKEVSTLALELAPLAAREIDIFNRVESQLAYHGHLSILVEAMRLAWPDVKSSSEIVPWGIDEFCTRAITYELLNHAGCASEPAKSDPGLSERLRFFSEVDAPQVASYLSHLTEWPGKAWTMGDFKLAQPRSARDDEEENELETGGASGDLHVYQLTVQFLGYLRRFEGVPFSKGELGRHDLYRFILERHEGKLEYRESMLESMQRDINRQQGRRTARLRKFRPYENVLLPDSERLEHYLAGLLGMMNQLYHRAAALFEIIPSWLRFLELQGLVDTAMRLQTFDKMEALAASLSRILASYPDDPAPLRALEGWRLNCQGAKENHGQQ
jgi:hypothetical protein